MTVGEAVGNLITCLIDGSEMSIQLRREVIKALPIECRWTREDGSIPPLETLQAVLDWKEQREDTTT